MFCALRIYEKNKTIADKLFGFMLKNEYKVTTVPVYKAAPFFLLDVTVHKKYPDAENIISRVGKCALRLVTSSRDRLQGTDGIGFFDSNLLYDKVIKNTFIKILENNFAMLPTDLCVIDTEGKNKDFVISVCKFAATLSVVTENKTDYLSVCDEITELTGICPVLKNKVENENIDLYTDENKITVINQDDRTDILKGDKIIMPDIYAKIIPEGVPELEFYSALYELCGVFALGDCVFEYITVNNEKKRVADVHFT